MKRIFLIIALITQYVAEAQKVNQCGIIIPPASATRNFQSVYEAGALCQYNA
jgi:hypothetical protein